MCFDGEVQDQPDRQGRIRVQVDNSLRETGRNPGTSDQVDSSLTETEQSLGMLNHWEKTVCREHVTQEIPVEIEQRLGTERLSRQPADRV